VTPAKPRATNNVLTNAITSCVCVHGTRAYTTTPTSSAAQSVGNNHGSKTAIHTGTKTREHTPNSAVFVVPRGRRQYRQRNGEDDTTIVWIVARSCSVLAPVVALLVVLQPIREWVCGGSLCSKTKGGWWRECSASSSASGGWTLPCRVVSCRVAVSASSSSFVAPCLFSVAGVSRFDTLAIGFVPPPPLPDNDRCCCCSCCCCRTMMIRSNHHPVGSSCFSPSPSPGGGVPLGYWCVVLAGIGAGLPTYLVLAVASVAAFRSGATTGASGA